MLTPVTRKFKPIARLTRETLGQRIVRRLRPRTIWRTMLHRSVQLKYYSLDRPLVWQMLAPFSSGFRTGLTGPVRARGEGHRAGPARSSGSYQILQRIREKLASKPAPASPASDMLQSQTQDAMETTPPGRAEDAATQRISAGAPGRHGRRQRRESPRPAAGPRPLRGSVEEIPAPEATETVAESGPKLRGSAVQAKAEEVFRRKGGPDLPGPVSPLDEYTAPTETPTVIARDAVSEATEAWKPAEKTLATPSSDLSEMRTTATTPTEVLPATIPHDMPSPQVGDLTETRTTVVIPERAERGGALRPATEEAKRESAPHPAVEAAEGGGAPRPATEAAEGGGVPRPATEAAEGGGAPRPVERDLRPLVRPSSGLLPTTESSPPRIQRAGAKSETIGRRADAASETTAPEAPTLLDHADAKQATHPDELERAHRQPIGAPEARKPLRQRESRRLVNDSTEKSSSTRPRVRKIGPRTGLRAPFFGGDVNATPEVGTQEAGVAEGVLPKQVVERRQDSPFDGGISRRDEAVAQKHRPIGSHRLAAAVESRTRVSTRPHHGPLVARKITRSRETTALSRLGAATTGTRLFDSGGVPRPGESRHIPETSVPRTAVTGRGAPPPDHEARVQDGRAVVQTRRHDGMTGRMAPAAGKPRFFTAMQSPIPADHPHLQRLGQLGGKSRPGSTGGLGTRSYVYPDPGTLGSAPANRALPLSPPMASPAAGAVQLALAPAIAVQPAAMGQAAVFPFHAPAAVIQRSVAEQASTAVAGTGEAGGGGETPAIVRGEAPGEKPSDHLEMMADQVYQILRRRLRVEQERVRGSITR